MSEVIVPIHSNYLYKLGFEDGWRAKTEELKKCFIARQNENREVIIEAVEKYFGMTLPEMKRRRRKRKFVLSRQMIAFFLCRYTKLKVMDIAELLEQDHTTVIHSRETIKDLLFTGNSEATSAVEAIENEVHTKLNETAPQQEIPEDRPPAEYSNRGHEKIVKEYSV